MSGCTNCNNGGCSGCGALTVPEGPIGLTGATGPAGANGANGTNGVDGPTWMSWSWSVGSDTPWIPGGGNATYKVAAEIIYPGYNTITPPTFVKVLSRGLDPTADYNIQLYDVTNALVIASLNNRTQITPTIDALAITVANWPAAQARLQIRIQDNQLLDNRVGLMAMTWHN